MKYQPPVRYSNGQIDRAGKALLEGKGDTKEYGDALEIINNWRASHQYPMNTFISTLHKRTRQYDGTIIAQRLKRFPTIIKKMERFPDMRLSRMQDIGGVRAIVSNPKELRALEAQYLSPGKLTHKLKKHKDYLTNPKSDGYRGIHLVYEYNNTRTKGDLAKNHNGLLVEAQLRTRLQHSWATTVEAMGAFLGDSFKNGYGNSDWRDFFCLASSAFALAENCKPCPGHGEYEPAEIYKRLSEIDKKIDALQHLKSLSVAARTIQNHVMSRKKRHLHYTIISLDLEKKSVEIWGFRKSDFDKAAKALEDLEKRSDGKYDQVLVSVSSILALKEAYPNYFLDISDFVDRIGFLIEKVKESGI